jgi:CheY-like chemotaxis protein
VDDSPDACNLLSMLLETQGHQVRIASTGRGAVAAAREFRPEAVLLDLGLPDISGLEVAVQLQQMPELGQVLLIALSGRDGPDDRRRTRAAGFHHHLVKPARVEELEQLLAGDGS